MNSLLPVTRLSLPLLVLLSLRGHALAGGEPTAAPGLLVQVVPVFNGQPLLLHARQYITAQGEKVTITACRFYLSHLRLTYADGSIYAEPDSYHLIDAEEESTHAVRLAQAPRKPLKVIAFSVGVDSAANVAGAQGGDLEPGRGMYWAWHSGYVNAKLEGQSPSCSTPRQEFEFHIGGFRAPYNSLRRVTLPAEPGSALPATLRVQADVGAWLRGVRLADTAAVLVPGPAAQTLADGYATMFRLLPALPATTAPRP